MFLKTYKFNTEALTQVVSCEICETLGKKWIWKNIITWTYSQENASDVGIFSAMAGSSAYNFSQGLDVFCEIYEGLRNVLFQKDSRETVSNFQ